MRRLSLGLLGAIAAAAVVWGAVVSWRSLVPPMAANALPLADGDQEVAWIYPATNGDSWERLVAALKNLEKDWPTVHADLPRLHVSFESAFLEQTAAIPQVQLYFEGFSSSKLWIRWYKLSGESDQQYWLEKLKRRGRAPLAVIGGDSSDRALTLATQLSKMRSTWPGSDPLFLITSATANRFVTSDDQEINFTPDTSPKLMEVYKDMSFRFCFTNERIAESVLDFVRDNPNLWPEYQHDAFAAAAVVGQGQPFDCLGVLAAAGQLRPVSLYALAWNDNRYSQDLADRFCQEFVKLFYQGNKEAAWNHCSYTYVKYSVGDFYQPNPSELERMEMYLGESRERRFTNMHQLLAVPAGVQPARRILRALCQKAPADMQNIVVVTGDSISFDDVYRDRDLAWNAVDVPLPLIFFSHHNPVDESAGWSETGDLHATGSQDLLLMRDLAEAFVQSAWVSSHWAADSVTVRDRLRQTHWHEGRVYGGENGGRRAEDGGKEVPVSALRPPSSALLLFGPDGNRAYFTGEHVVWLQPMRESGRNLAQATLSVWRIDREIESDLTWKRVRDPLTIKYNQIVGNNLGGMP